MENVWKDVGGNQEEIPSIEEVWGGTRHRSKITDRNEGEGSSKKQGGR